MTHGNPNPRALPAAVWVLSASTFLTGTSEFLVAGLLPQVARSFDVTVAQAGLSITVFAIGMVVGAPAIVLLTLRLPRRAILALALGVFAVGHVIAAISGAFTLLIIARFVTALAASAVWGIASHVATDLVGRDRSSRALGVVIGGGMLANVLGVPIGALAGQLGGWRGPFWGLAVLAGIAAVVMWRVIPSSTAGHPAPSVRRELRVLRSGRLWVTLTACAFVTGGVLSVYSFIAPILTDRAGLPESYVPVALIVFGAASVAGTLIAGRTGDRHPWLTLVIGAGVTVLAMLGLLSLSDRPALMLAFFTLLGLTGLATNPVLIAMAIRYGHAGPTLAGALTPSAFNLGTAIGTGVSAVTLASAAGPLGPLLVGLVGAVLVLIFTLVLASLSRSRIRDPPSSATLAFDKTTRPPRSDGATPELCDSTGAEQ